MSKFLAALKPLKMDQDASKWLLRAWLLATFGEQSDSAREVQMPVISELLEVVKAIAVYSRDEVSLSLTVIGKLGEAYPAIKPASKDTLVQLITEQRQAVGNAFDNFSLNTEAIAKLVESSKKMSSILSAVRLNSYIDIAELKGWHVNIQSSTFDLLSDEVLSEISDSQLETLLNVPIQSLRQLMLVNDGQNSGDIVAHRTKLLQLHERSSQASKSLVVFKSFTTLLCMTAGDITSQDLVNQPDVSKCLRSAIEFAAAPMMLSTE